MTQKNRPSQDKKLLAIVFVCSNCHVKIRVVLLPSIVSKFNPFCGDMDMNNSAAKLPPVSSATTKIVQKTKGTSNVLQMTVGPYLYF